VSSHTFDVEKAAHALSESGSRFCAHAADWLMHMDDPVALLLVLTKETGPALGPWATFRWCALLGLTPASAVRALADDIASEEPDHPLASVDAAFAKGHAKSVYPELAVANVDEIVRMLARTDHDDVETARLALAQAGLAESDARDARSATVRALLDDQRHARRADVALEAALLASRDDRLADHALSILSAAQRDDGLVSSSSKRVRDDRFTTLRTLALVTRMARERP